ncbi:37336_t:CDS:2, partial [Gigaspora margarita]
MIALCVVFNIPPDLKLEKLVIEYQREEIKKCNLFSRLQTIKVSTLIIHSENDELIPIQEEQVQSSKYQTVSETIYTKESELIIELNDRKSID